MLPFGLRSALKIFKTVANALEWCISKEGADSVYHYLDDYIVLGPPKSSAQWTYTHKRVCEGLKIPLALEK